MGVPISSLPVASDLTGDEVFPIVQSGSTKQTTLNDIPYTPAGTGAVATTVQSKLLETVSVFDFMTASQIADVQAGTASVDVTTAIQNAIDKVKVVGGKLNFPAGTYKITSALVIDTASYTNGLILSGEGRNTIISQTGAGQDAIKFSTTQFLQNSGIRDMLIRTSATAGHCINIVYGCTTCFIDNVDLEQGNPAKACIYGNYTSFGGGVYDTKFRGGSWYCNAASTEAGVRFIANGTIFNENVFENLRCYYANTVQFFKITTAVLGSIWLINNTWKNINFEVCKGGGILFDSFKNCKLENISFWDAGGAYTNNLIDMVSGAGYESVSNTFINVGRNGDSLAASVNDIRVVSGQDTVLINCYTQSGDSPRYDLNNKRVVVIGKLFGTVNNLGGMTVLNSIDGLCFPGTVNGASLNYYDEGTWTATLGGSTADPTTPVTATGRWTRIGRFVKADVAFVNVTTTGATGAVQIRGLPFAPVGLNTMGLVGLSGVGANAAVGIATVGSTTISLVQQANIASNITHGAGTGQFIYCSMSYTV